MSSKKQFHPPLIRNNREKGIVTYWVFSLVLPVTVSACRWLASYRSSEVRTSLTSIRQSIGGGLSSTAQGILGRIEVARALVLSTVCIGSGGVTDLLGGRLLAAWLEGASNLVGCTADILGEDLSGGLLRLRGDLLPDLLTEAFAPILCK